MNQGDILAFTTMLEKAEQLKQERSEIRRQTALQDRKHIAAVRIFAGPSPSFRNLENMTQNERFSDITAKSANQQGPSQQNNTLRPQGFNKKKNKTLNQNQQMTSEIFHQQMQKNKNTQKQLAD